MILHCLAESDKPIASQNLTNMLLHRFKSHERARLAFQMTKQRSKRHKVLAATTVRTVVDLLPMRR